MPWFKVDDNLAFHAKTVAAGNAAMGLWVRAGSWSSQQLTDGHVPAHIAKSLGKRSEAARLVDVGLWKVDEKGDGFRFWQWGDRNPQREQVEEARQAARERMQRAREARRSREQPANVQANIDECSGERSPEVRSIGSHERSLTPTRPDPTRPDPKEEPPPTAVAARPGSALAKTGTASAVVAAYVDAVRAAGAPLDSRAKGRVAKEAAALLSNGAPHSLLVTAAQRLAVNGYADLGAEARRLHAELHPPKKQSTTDQRIAQTLALAESFRDQETA